MNEWQKSVILDIMKKMQEESASKQHDSLSDGTPVESVAGFPADIFSEVVSNMYYNDYGDDDNYCDYYDYYNDFNIDDIDIEPITDEEKPVKKPPIFESSPEPTSDSSARKKYKDELAEVLKSTQSHVKDVQNASQALSGSLSNLAKSLDNLTKIANARMDIVAEQEQKISELEDRLAQKEKDLAKIRLAFKQFDNVVDEDGDFSNIEI